MYLGMWADLRQTRRVATGWLDPFLSWISFLTLPLFGLIVNTVKGMAALDTNF